MPKTDVLIVGSGSAGIFAATWLAIYNIPFTILERRSGPLEIGQADGVQVRTVEIYDSFGLAEDLLREAYHIYEVCFWGVDDQEGGIKRKSRSIDTEKGLSHLPHVILNQARMNGLMLGKMEKIMKEKGTWQEGGANGIEYGWTVTGIEVNQDTVTDSDAHCVRVSATKNSISETWEAKYVLVSPPRDPFTVLKGFLLIKTGLRRRPLNRPPIPQLPHARRLDRHRLGRHGHLPADLVPRHQTQVYDTLIFRQPTHHPARRRLARALLHPASTWFGAERRQTRRLADCSTQHLRTV